MNSSRRDWLRRMLTESEKFAIEPEVGQPEVVMVRVRNVAQYRNHDSRVLNLGKCHDQLSTTETGSRATGTGSSDVIC